MRKLIPNTITSMNLVCGIIGVIFAFEGRHDVAFVLMLAASVFDFLDGFAARALHSYSDIGKELDSLCDLVSFGVLPAVMLFKSAQTCSFGSSWACWIALAIAVFSALRLAKFNVDPRQTDGFIGLATPTCAMLIGSLCCYVAFNPGCFLAVWMSSPVFVVLLTLTLCYLLVCEMPMFSLKLHKDDSQILRNKRIALGVIAVCAVIVCVVCKLHWSVVVLITSVCYILKNTVYALLKI